MVHVRPARWVCRACPCWRSSGAPRERSGRSWAAAWPGSRYGWGCDVAPVSLRHPAQSLSVRLTLLKEVQNVHNQCWRCRRSRWDPFWQSSGSQRALVISGDHKRVITTRTEAKIESGTPVICLLRHEGGPKIIHWARATTNPGSLYKYIVVLICSNFLYWISITTIITKILFDILFHYFNPAWIVMTTYIKEKKK